MFNTLNSNYKLPNPLQFHQMLKIFATTFHAFWKGKSMFIIYQHTMGNC